MPALVFFCSPKPSGYTPLGYRYLYFEFANCRGGSCPSCSMYEIVSYLIPLGLQEYSKTKYRSPVMFSARLMCGSVKTDPYSILCVILNGA